jgi:3-methyladenine DNA glycosylase AlkD
VTAGRAQGAYSPRFAAQIRKELAAAADPQHAPRQQAYMKSAMPYYGVKMPELRAICKRVFAENPPATSQEWQGEVLGLWRGAKHREERYAAMELAGQRRYSEFRTPSVMPMFEEMIVTGAWWDYVDEIAHLVGDLLRSHPKKMRPMMRAWSVDQNLWKRRVSIICQISFKKDTDLDLLYSNIKPNLADRDFFIRKAIGWALRAYAWTDPDEVARFVREHESSLSGLSRREALKNIA